MSKAAFTIVLATCLLSGSVDAQQTAVESTIPTEAVGNPSPPVNHVLTQTFIDQGPSGGGIPKGNQSYTFGNAVSFNCRRSCTLEVDIMLQIGQNTTKGNLWDICAQVDQSGKDFSCAYQSTLPTDKTYVVGNYAWSVSLKKGKHLVQSTVYTAVGPAQLGTYHALYRVYQP